MKILFNLGTLKKGGGLTVGLNYVQCLLSGSYDLARFFFVVPENSALEAMLVGAGLKNFKTVPNNAIKRILFELLYGWLIIKRHEIDVVYTLFGIGFYGKDCIQISGSADSNLFFPEIDFWHGYTGVGRIKKRIIDIFRIHALSKADVVVFENEAMLKRSRELFNLENVLYSKPSINVDLSTDKLDLPTFHDSLVGLFLCGWQKNKNYMIIPELLCEFKRRNIKFHILFTTTVSEHYLHKEFMLEIKKLGVEDMITFVGPVKKAQLKCLYGFVDYVFLLSKLESFSNNIIESWFFEKPLVIADEPWSRSICKDAAIYVNRDSVGAIVDKILDVEHCVLSKSVLLESSRILLKTFPSMQEKLDFELEYINSYYEENR